MARQTQRRLGHSADLEIKLKALARFAGIFGSSGFSFGKWVTPPPTPDGIEIFPYFDFSEDASRFQKMAYEVGWVKQLNWSKWMRTKVAQRMINNPAKVAGATPDQLFKLLTSYIRGDRFSEGALNSAWESGLLTAIAARAEVLYGEMKQKEHTKADNGKRT